MRWTVPVPMPSDFATLSGFQQLMGFEVNAG